MEIIILFTSSKKYDAKSNEFIEALTHEHNAHEAILHNLSQMSAKDFMSNVSDLSGFYLTSLFS